MHHGRTAQVRDSVTATLLSPCLRSSAQRSPESCVGLERGEAGMRMTGSDAECAKKCPRDVQPQRFFLNRALYAANTATGFNVAVLGPDSDCDVMR